MIPAPPALCPKSAISALRFNSRGLLLASGGLDTNIVVWDVVGEAGLYKLSGHRDQVTDLVSRSPPAPPALISPIPVGIPLPFLPMLLIVLTCCCRCSARCSWRKPTAS